MSRKFEEEELGSNKKNSNIRRSKGKSKSNSRGSRGRGNSSRNVSPSRGDVNDAGYYFPDPMIKDQLASFSFSNFLGDHINLGKLNFDQPFGLANYVTIPSIMRVFLNPAASTVNSGNEGFTDGINAAARRLFLQLSAGNAKSTSYGPEDVALAILGIGNVLENISAVRRVFGIANMFNQRNRIVPQMLITSMGIDYEDFTAHIADYRSQFNYVITQFNKIPFFSNISYFAKCNTLYDHVYLDSPNSSMAQLILLMPRTCWLWDDAYSSAGSGLATSTNFIAAPGDYNIDTSVETMEYVLRNIQNQINKLFNSTALLKVYSDVLRLVDTKGVPKLELPILPVDYAIVPQYSEEIMLMIHNATIPGVPIDESTYEALVAESAFTTQYFPTPNNDVVGNADEANIKYAPVFSTTGGVVPVGPAALLDLWKDKYTSDDIVYATRFMVTAADWYTSEDGEQKEKFTTHVSLPDHYVTAVDYYTSGSAAIIQRATVIHGDERSGADSDEVLLASLIDKFESHPRLIAIAADTNSFVRQYGDVDYYTTVDHNVLTRLNDFAMVGLLALR